MTMARPANSEFPLPELRTSALRTMGRRTQKYYNKKSINNSKGAAAALRRTHFRNEFVADMALAAYVNESTRYRTMGRLGMGSTVGTSIGNLSSSSQACHKAKAENSSTNDGHDPVDLSLSRPSIPTAEFVGNCQPSGQILGTYKRPMGVNNDPMIKAGIRISGFPTPLLFAR